MIALAVAVAVQLSASPVSVSYEGVDSALTHAKRDGRRVLLYVHASWCLPCRRMAREFFETSAGAEVLKDVHVASIDFDRDRRFLRPWNVHAVPTLIVLRADGSEVDRLTGYLNPQELALRLSTMLRPALTLDQLDARRAQAHDDGEKAALDVQIGEAKQKAGAPDDAMLLFESVAARDVPAAADALFFLGVAMPEKSAADSASALGVWRELFTRFPESARAPAAEVAYAEHLAALKERYADGVQLGFQALRRALHSTPQTSPLVAVRVDNLVQYAIVHDIHRELARADVEDARGSSIIDKDEAEELIQRLKKKR